MMFFDFNRYYGGIFVFDFPKDKIVISTCCGFVKDTIVCDIDGNIARGAFAVLVVTNNDAEKAPFGSIMLLNLDSRGRVLSDLEQPYVISERDKEIIINSLIYPEKSFFESKI